MESTIQLERQQKILKHLPLVHQCVSKLNYNRPGFDRDDLFQVGVLGLMNAVDRFQPSLGVPFEYYAGIRIRGSITDALRKAGHLSKEKVSALMSFYQKKSDLEQQMLRTVSDQELSEHLGLSEKSMSDLYQTMMILPAVSLDEILFEDGQSPSLKERLLDPDVVSPEDALIQQSLNDALNQALTLLGEREQLLLQLYYLESLSFKEIAAVLEVSVPRVSQIHARALMALRAQLDVWR